MAEPYRTSCLKSDSRHGGIRSDDNNSAISRRPGPTVAAELDAVGVRVNPPSRPPRAGRTRRLCRRCRKEQQPRPLGRAFCFRTLHLGGDCHGSQRQSARLRNSSNLFATGIALSLLLIAAYSRPFTGEISVGPDLLKQVMPRWEAAVSTRSIVSRTRPVLHSL
jgi:hypothetical protein